MLAAFLSSRIPVVAATTCGVPFLLDPAAPLGRTSPWQMKLQCLDLVAAFLLGVSSAVCTCQPPTASMLALFRLPGWSSVHAWLLRLRIGSDFAPERLPAPDPVLHVSAPVRRGAVADARLGLGLGRSFFFCGIGATMNVAAAPCFLWFIHDAVHACREPARVNVCWHRGVAAR